MDTKEPKKDAPDTENRASVKNVVLVVLVLLAVIIAGSVYSNRSELPQVWKNVSLAAVSVSSLFSPNERLDITSGNYTVESGKIFSMTYSHKGKRTGTNETYFFQYKCSAGLSITLISASGSRESIFCDSPFDISKLATTTLNLIPVITKKNSASTTLGIIYQRTGANEKTLTATADIEVVKSFTTSDNANGAIIPRTAGQKTEQLYRIGGEISSTTASIPSATSDPNGSVDLAVRILEIGMTDKTTNLFTATSTLKSTDRIAVRFEVENVGTRTSKEWTFSASLPTYPWYIFQSDNEQPLAPGDRIEFTLGFDNIEKTDGNSVTINVEPNNQINDNQRDNNIATTTINNVEF